MIEYEYGVKSKPASPGNLQANTIIDIIHHILGNLLCTYNLQETYIDDADPLMGILAETAVAVQCTYHIMKDRSPGQLLFGRDIILPINHVLHWRYIRQRKQTQINIDVKC